METPGCTATHLPAAPRGSAPPEAPKVAPAPPAPSKRRRAALRQLLRLCCHLLPPATTCCPQPPLQHRRLASDTAGTHRRTPEPDAAPAAPHRLLEPPFQLLLFLAEGAAAAGEVAKAPPGAASEASWQGSFLAPFKEHWHWSLRRSSSTLPPLETHVPVLAPAAPGTPQTGPF